MPRKTRLALAAVAAGAVTAAAAPATYAASAAPHAAAIARAAEVTAAANQLSFGPLVDRPDPGVGGPDDYTVGFSGPGCSLDSRNTVALCADPAAAAATAWTLDVQDLAGTMSKNLGTGTGNSVHGSVLPYTFPTPPTGSSGTWKVTVAFTDGTTTWSSSTLIDYGGATTAPPTPWPVGNGGPDELLGGQPVPFTIATGRAAAAGSNLVVDFGDGSGRQTVLVTGTSTTFTHVYPVAKATYTAWFALSDGVNQSSWQALIRKITPIDPKLTVTPAVGTASVLDPLTVTLDATGATTATPGAKITKWQFTCDDGVTAKPVPNQPAKATCTYTTLGSYHVSVAVTDSNGVQLTSPAQTVTVGAGATYLPPNLGLFTVAPDAAKPLSVTADLSRVILDAHTDPAKARFTIDWGDETKQTFTKADLPAGAQLPHTYLVPGYYNVQLTVDDGLGQSGSSQSSTVRVGVAPPPKGPAPVFRVAGGDRYDTGVQVSRGRWADASDTKALAFMRADSVVLATGGGFADALAGVPFSVYKNGALLLTEPNQLTGEVRDEIKRILPADGRHTVYVLGGTAALSPAVVNALTGMGYRVQRISGADRYGTALQIAHAMGDPAHTVVARGDDFADALSAGPLASDLFGTGAGGNYVPAAVVLSDNKTLDSATKAYLQSRFAATSGLSVIAVGGGAAAAVTTAPGFDGTSSARNSGQLSGGDRYETARKVADIFSRAAPGAPVGVATGLAYPDALTGGAFMSSLGGPLLLTDPKAASPAMTGALAARADTTVGVFVFGGPNAVAPGVFDAVVAAVKGVVEKF